MMHRVFDWIASALCWAVVVTTIIVALPLLTLLWIMELLWPTPYEDRP